MVCLYPTDLASVENSPVASQKSYEHAKMQNLRHAAARKAEAKSEKKKSFHHRPSVRSLLVPNNSRRPLHDVYQEACLCCAPRICVVV
jgi:hypothetical protein